MRIARHVLILLGLVLLFTRNTPLALVGCAMAIVGALLVWWPGQLPQGTVSSFNVRKRVRLQLVIFAFLGIGVAVSFLFPGGSSQGIWIGGLIAGLGVVLALWFTVFRTRQDSDK
jgi:hypothetical protein